MVSWNRIIWNVNVFLVFLNVLSFAARGQTWNLAVALVVALVVWINQDEE